MIDAIFRYPRTHHLEGSRLQPGDQDLEQVPLAELRGTYCVIEEKLDGANAGMSLDDTGRVRLQSRGHVLVGGPREKHWDLFKQWARTHEAVLARKLAGLTLYGEWLYAKHTIFYDELPHYFLEFDIRDESGAFWSTACGLDIGEGDRTGIQGRERGEPYADLGEDAGRVLAASQEPQQLVRLVDLDELAGPRHEPRTEEIVRGKAVAPRQWSEPSSEQESDDANGRGRTGDRCEAMLGCRGDDSAPLRAGADRCDAGRRIDAHVIDALRRDRETVADGVVRAVSRSLHRDRDSLLACVANGFDDIVLVHHADHEIGHVLDREVEGGELGSEAHVDGNVHGAADAICERCHGARTVRQNLSPPCAGRHGACSGGTITVLRCDQSVNGMRPLHISTNAMFGEPGLRYAGSLHCAGAGTATLCNGSVNRTVQPLPGVLSAAGPVVPEE